MTLTKLSLFAVMALSLVACGDATPDTTETPSPLVATPPAIDMASDDAQTLAADDSVVITVDRLIAEEAACLLMIDVANGTDQTITAGLFAFDVTGNGEEAGANMFPQRTEPGEITTAQIILPGANCDNAQYIEGGQINCRITDTEESCIDKVELRDGVIDFVTND